MRSQHDRRPARRGRPFSPRSEEIAAGIAAASDTLRRFGRAVELAASRIYSPAEFARRRSSGFLFGPGCRRGI